MFCFCPVFAFRLFFYKVLQFLSHILPDIVSTRLLCLLGVSFQIVQNVPSRLHVSPEL